jgi:hypothetical protein
MRLGRIAVTKQLETKVFPILLHVVPPTSAPIALVWACKVFHHDYQ